MDIFSAIPAELALLRESFLMGVGLCVAYDSIRVLRRVLPHGILWLSLEDFLYWIFVAGWFFFRMCKVNDGIIRLYALAALMLGAVLYYGLVGRLVMKRVSFFILLAKKRLKKIRRIVTMRLEKLRKHGDGV